MNLGMKSRIAERVRGGESKFSLRDQDAAERGLRCGWGHIQGLSARTILRICYGWTCGACCEGQRSKRKKK